MGKDLIVLEVVVPGRSRQYEEQSGLEADVAKEDNEKPFRSDVTRRPKHGLTVRFPAPKPQPPRLIHKTGCSFSRGFAWKRGNSTTR